MDTRFDQLSHAKIRLIYHVVLATKYRKPVLCNIEEYVYEACRECERVSDFRILTMGIDNGDHIHLLIQVCKSELSIASVIRRIKQYTLKVLYSGEYTCDVLKSFYYGGKRKLWSNGYFVASVGNNVDVVRSYIDNQV